VNVGARGARPLGPAADGINLKPVRLQPLQKLVDQPRRHGLLPEQAVRYADHVLRDQLAQVTLVHPDGDIKDASQ